ncbi:hypothetical protein CLPU_21c00420 [Gottschalkia purinilytica]|uniref:Uncharacterized protein n=1 Tax=Gottschalkia purinilytica TaxID=1503 RepID=A0A0L0W6R9_GOTPU|nr:hypothetical protein [Gottschalkia purinilytica]KNF07224.1 hypothetical protein CLPU_21c00420 [Gottschalkia purinilytica]
MFDNNVKDSLEVIWIAMKYTIKLSYLLKIIYYVQVYMLEIVSSIVDISLYRYIYKEKNI